MAALIVAASDLPAAPVLALMGAGVLIAIAGHISRSQRTVVVGIVLIFVATAAMVLGGYLAFEDDSSDPRPSRPPSDSGF